MRLAVAANGDDTTFSRFVKLPDRPAKEGKKSQLRLPTLGNPSIEAGRSVFYRKGVKAPSEMKRLLVSGHSNVKIGRDVRIGKFKGYWLYTLSLEERATCPRACHHWQDCYGNNMPFAKRIDHTAANFLTRLEQELIDLLAVAKKRAGAPGIIVRLHALGDFYSSEYVLFWDRMLRENPKLVLFGYTAWKWDTEIGAQVRVLVDTHPARAMIRVSNGGTSVGSTVPIRSADDCPPGAFVCPEQTGQFDACGKCGACWSTLKNVAFLAH